MCEDPIPTRAEVIGELTIDVPQEWARVEPSSRMRVAQFQLPGAARRLAIANDREFARKADARGRLIRGNVRRAHEPQPDHADANGLTRSITHEGWTKPQMNADARRLKKKQSLPLLL